MKFNLRHALCCLCASVLAVTALFAQEAPFKEQRQKAQKLFSDGNCKDAYDILSKLALDPKDDPGEVGQDLGTALQALRSLNRTSESDAFRDKVIEAHSRNWRLLFAAAETFLNGDHWGFVIAGEFQRGQHRGGGRYVSSEERDRVCALRLLEKAMAAAKGETDAAALSSFYLRFADMLLGSRGYSESWRLQYLTDLSELPDYGEGGATAEAARPERRSARTVSRSTTAFRRATKPRRTTERNGDGCWSRPWRWPRPGRTRCSRSSPTS